jgi:16S rRNA (guanine966-N2)-methyltransferase
MVRITGGVLRGRRLAVPRGMRPTTELARKAVFDILGDTIEGARVLDAAAGSGAYGLEALSRGASSVTFVESDRKVLKVLKENIERLAERFAVPRVSVAGTSIASFVVSHLPSKSVFDVIFHDPPYDAESQPDLLSLLSLLSPSGVLFHERGDDRRVAPGGRSPDEVRRYGRTCFLVFRGTDSSRA